MGLTQTGFGYRDAAKALTLKALQERQKQAAAATAAAQSATDINADPLSGVAHVANVFSGALQQNRADSAELAGRQRLAELMSKTDPKTGLPVDITAIGMLDPEQGQRLQEEIARRQRDDFEWTRTQDDQIADEQRAQTVKDAEHQRALDEGRITALTPEEAKARNLDPSRRWAVSADAKTLTDITAAAPAETWRPMSPQERQAYGVPEGSTGQISNTGKIDTEAPGGGVTVNNNPDAKGATKWSEKRAEKFGERVDAYSGEGVAAKQQLNQIDQLEFLSRDMPTGVDAKTIQYLKDNWGVSLGEGADKLSAFNAIISRMVPSQRPPGSGTMSDRDIDLFRASLPNYVNTPEGNRLVLASMRGIAQYNAALGDIADRAMEFDDPQEARKFFTTEVNKLPDPLAEWRAAEGQSKKAATPANPADPAAQGESVDDIVKRNSGG